MYDPAALAWSIVIGAFFSCILCLVVLWKKKTTDERLRAFARMIGPGIGFAIGSMLAGGWARGLASALGFYLPILLFVYLERIEVQQPSE